MLVLTVSIGALVTAGTVVTAHQSSRAALESGFVSAPATSPAAAPSTTVTSTTVPATTTSVTSPPTTVSPPTTLGASGSAPARSSAASTLRTGRARPPGFPATVADAKGPTVNLYGAPNEPEAAQVLDNPTWEGLPVVLLVQQRIGDWLEVQVSMRPNESTAWVRASEVSLREVPYRIVVDTGAKRLTAFSPQGVFLDVAVAVGAGSSPTPTGNYFIDGAVKVPYDDGPYGAYQLSVAAFSNVHYSFAGGVGQIAIHGTNDPALIGTPASNGCVRMTNEDVTRLALAVPVGTPVQIL